MALLGLMIIALQQAQFTATRYATNSQHTALALNLAQDIAKRMQLNSAATEYLGNWSSLSASKCEDVNNPCTPHQLAQHDIAEVMGYTKQVLPQPQIQVLRCTGNFWCINIAWNGTNAARCQLDEQNNCISLRYIPRL